MVGLEAKLVKGKESGVPAISAYSNPPLYHLVVLIVPDLRLHTQHHQLVPSPHMESYKRRIA